MRYTFLSLNVFISLLIFQTISYTAQTDLSEADVVINDVTHLTPTFVQKIEKPTTIESLQEIIRAAAKKGLKVSVCGTRYSQGGHICYPNAIVIDLTKLNKINHIDIIKKEITVQAGATWEQIQHGINGLGLALKAMQSYHDFSVGGSLSVNAHGQDIKKPMLISCVKKFKLVMPDGSLKVCSRDENAELFSAVLGGYGLIGVIVEATLELTENNILEKKAKRMKTIDYPEYFEKYIQDKGHIHLHSARLSMNPFSYLNDLLCVTYYDTTEELFDNNLKKHNNMLRDKIAFFLLKKTYTANILRSKIEENFIETNEIITRNNAMGSSVLGLCQHNDSDVDILQEYFIPLNRFNEFITVLKKTLPLYKANVLNITIRYVPKNTESMLTYAPEDCFAFVLFINHKRNNTALETIKTMTKALIESVYKLDGTYYLPYQLYATKEQLNSIYPRFQEFLNLKKIIDPNECFVNHFYMYYKGSTNDKKGY